MEPVERKKYYQTEITNSSCLNHTFVTVCSTKVSSTLTFSSQFILTCSRITSRTIWSPTTGLWNRHERR